MAARQVELAHARLARYNLHSHSFETDHPFQRFELDANGIWKGSRLRDMQLILLP